MIFLKKNTTTKVVTLIVIVSALLLSSCVPQTPTPTPEPQPTPIDSVVPKKVLRIWNPESPTILNPYLAGGVKDFEPSRIVYEPLASFNDIGNLIPVLAQEIPSLQNGGLAKDGKSVTWKLRQDVKWSDGESFTADDVMFTYSYIAKVAPSLSEYSQVTDVKALDDVTIQITFKNPNPAWDLPFVGIRGVILPRHVFEPYAGDNAREAPANTLPVGTGPYYVATAPGIKPQEVILLGLQVVKTTKIVFLPNPYYRSQDKLAFKQVVWYGGGPIDIAKQQLLTDGTLDVAYRFDLVGPTELAGLFENSNKGKLVSAFVPGVDRILINHTAPYTASPDGEYSSLVVPHPLFSDKIIRQAFAYAINRDRLAALFGVIGKPAYVNLIDPPQYRSDKVFYEYNLQKANALLDESGYIDTNGDAFREKDGVNMKVVFMSYVDPILQEEQKIIQADLNAIGIDVELKKVDSSIMFGDDTTNPDSEYQFNADMMMFRQRSLSPDPSAFMQNWTCAQIPQKSNNWSAGNNDERWCNPEYDAVLQQANVELDPDKREKLFIDLNDMLIEDVVMIPTVWRASALGVNSSLEGLVPTPWDSLTWNIQDWSFTQP